MSLDTLMAAAKSFGAGQDKAASNVARKACIGDELRVLFALIRHEIGQRLFVHRARANDRSNLALDVVLHL